MSDKNGVCQRAVDSGIATEPIARPFRSEEGKIKEDKKEKERKKKAKKKKKKKKKKEQEQID